MKATKLINTKCSQFKFRTTMFTTTKVNSFFTDLAPTQPVISLSMSETNDQNRYNEQIISRMSRNDQFFGCFLPHLPKGARITDTTTFHWGKWDQSVLHGLDSSGKPSAARRPASLCWRAAPTTRLANGPSRNTTRVTRECYKCSKVTVKCFVATISRINRANLERVNFIRRCVNSFVFLPPFRALCFCFLFSMNGRRVH